MGCIENYTTLLFIWSIYSNVSSFISIRNETNISLFRTEQIIFTSNHNITKLLVPSDGTSYFLTDNSKLPSIFFTIADSKLDGGSCIYVLEDFAAYEILEGGRDSTSDYSADKTVYFGGKNGVYKFNSESLSAKKFGLFTDDIIQIHKANGSDVIYYLTNNNKLFKIESNGTVKTKVEAVICALQFVLDTSNNIYFIACEDGLPRIVKSDGTLVSFTATVVQDFKDIKLLRPAFVMEQCIPFFGDGYLYILYANGTSEKKDFYINENPSAYSVDAGLYLVAALNGKIYEFNVMEAMLKSMFRFSSQWTGITKMVMSIMETDRHGYYKDWNSLFIN